MNPDLLKSAQALIRAEYLFRCGPNAYDAATADWYAKAQADFYEAVTGKRDLTDAGRVLGIIKGRKPLKG